MKKVFSLMLSACVACGCLMMAACTPSPETEPKKLPDALFEEVEEVKEVSVAAPQFEVIPVAPQAQPEMVRCYSKNKKPATMEDEAMRRAKVFHRGLPIEGCAPLSPEEHQKRFNEEKQKLATSQKNAEVSAAQ